MYSPDDTVRFLVSFCRPDVFALVITSRGSGTVGVSFNIAKFHIVRLRLHRPGSCSFACNSFFAFAPEVSLSVKAIRSSSVLAGHAGELQAASRVWVIAGAFEGAQVEDTAQEGPAVGNIGNDDCGRCLPSIPIEVDQATVPSGEIVVAVQDGTQDLCWENHMSDLCLAVGMDDTYNKDTETEDS